MLEDVAVREPALARLMPCLLFRAERAADLLLTCKQRPHDLIVNLGTCRLSASEALI